MDNVENEKVDIVKLIKRGDYKPIKGFSKYLVSKDGKIYSTISNKFMKSQVNHKTGYLELILKGDDNQRKTCTVHRLVALTYCKKPNGCNHVNHINEIKTDCRAENLEWCTQKYNNTYNGKDQRSCKKVVSTNEHTGEETIWNSARIAARTLGVSYKNISAVCRGLRPRCAGLKWRFLNG